MTKPARDDAATKDAWIQDRLGERKYRLRATRRRVPRRRQIDAPALASTGGLQANFAGSDLIVDTADPKRKLLIQVKSGYNPRPDQVYLTQCQGEKELQSTKFVSDFVVFVNIDRKVGTEHQHDGSLGFEHLSYFVVPRDAANRIYLR